MAPATTSFINVADIRDDILILQNGGLRAVIAVPGINFHLLSGQEQEIVINQFMEFINGLDFTIQILIVSRFANIEAYLKMLEERLARETEELVRIQLEEYIGFIKSFVETHRVMKKLFYMVIPFDPLPTEQVAGIARAIRLQKTSALSHVTFNESTYENLREQLETRVLYITEGLGYLGLRPIRLNTNELIQLLYESYNPQVRLGISPQIVSEL